MTIWILAFLLVASGAGLGYRQGAVRVAFSLAGIFSGALLAAPLSRLIKPIFVTSGLKDPLLLWLIPPLASFVLVLAVFKVIALAVHQKVEVHYKYNTGDLKQALWERLNRRLGLCLGLVNGTAYFVLLVMALYPLSYWTYQMAAADSDPRSIRLVNQFGSDLQKTGMSKVAGALNQNPPEFYEAADLAGLIYHHPLLEARLSRYPAFLGLAERSDFQDLGSDIQFAELCQKQASLADLLGYPKVQNMLQNPDLLKTLKDTLMPNLQDLQAFLTNGVSQKFTEKILGRWDFDVNTSMMLLRKANPTITSNKMKDWKRWMASIYSKATFVAAPAPEHQAFLKNMPRLSGGGQPGDLQTLQGQWKGADGSYTLTMSSENKEMTAQVNGDRITISGSGMDLAFTRED